MNEDWTSQEEFEISEQLLADWIEHAKSEYNEDLTEDMAIEEIVRLHEIGCLVEHSHNCCECPLFNSKCPLNHA